MKKKIKIFLLLLILIAIYVYTACVCLLPNTIVLMQGESLKFTNLWGINIKQESSSNPNIGEYRVGKLVQTSNAEESSLTEVGKLKLSVNLFNNISLKEVDVNIIPKTKVIPLRKCNRS